MPKPGVPPGRKIRPQSAPRPAPGVGTQAVPFQVRTSPSVAVGKSGESGPSARIWRRALSSVAPIAAKRGRVGDPDKGLPHRSEGIGYPTLQRIVSPVRSLLKGFATLGHRRNGKGSAAWAKRRISRLASLTPHARPRRDTSSTGGVVVVMTDATGLDLRRRTADQKNKHGKKKILHQSTLSTMTFSSDTVIAVVAESFMIHTSM